MEENRYFLVLLCTMQGKLTPTSHYLFFLFYHVVLLLIEKCVGVCVCVWARVRVRVSVCVSVGSVCT